MEPWTFGIGIAAGVILFLYGIEGFSREVETIAGERFRELLGRYVKRPIHGILLGAITTAIVQSSTATSVIAVALVNSGILTFRQSLGVIIGSNIGTTLTAQLVAFKLTAIGPAFLVVGFLFALAKWRFRFLGKAFFYFGLVFFALNEIAASLEPLQNSPQVLNLLAQVSSPALGIIAGVLTTVVLQSSTVTTGLVLVLIQSGLLSVDAGAYLVLGANVGTTVTAGLAALRMDVFAKRTALAHIMFNVGGVVLVAPLVPWTIELLKSFDGEPSHLLANFHLAFNTFGVLVFGLFVGYFEKMIIALVPGRKDDVAFAPRHLRKKPAIDTDEAVQQIEAESEYAFTILRAMLIEAAHPAAEHDDEIKQLAKKRLFLKFIGQKIVDAIGEVSRRDIDRSTRDRLIALARFIGLIEYAAGSMDFLSRSVYALRSSMQNGNSDFLPIITAARDRLDQVCASLEERMHDRRTSLTGSVEAALAELDSIVNTNYLTLFERKNGASSLSAANMGSFSSYLAHLQSTVSILLEMRRLLIDAYADHREPPSA